MSSEKTTKKNQPPKRKQRVLLTVLCVVLAVLLAALVTIVVYAEYILGSISNPNGEDLPTLSQEEINAIQNPEDDDPDSTAPEVDPEDITWADDPVTEIGGEGIVNILLIGQDRRPGEGRARSDAMILCSFNLDKKTITMTSFMRDIYVQIPGYMDNKINAAFQLGGAELLSETIYTNFGVKIDGAVSVDFSQFKDVIDLLGGVDIELSEAEAYYLNTHDWETVDNSQWNLKGGWNHLNGDQALSYARIRKIGNGDHERTDRQRTVLNALLKAYKNTSMTQMVLLLDDLVPMVTTNMTQKEIVGYATDLLPLVSSLNTDSIVSQRIPADGDFYYADIRNLDVIVVDMDASRKLLADSIQGD